MVEHWRRRRARLPRHLVLARPAGVPIGCTHGLALCIVLLAVLALAGWAVEAALLLALGVVVSGSLLVHELAHGVAARLHGYDLDGVVVGMVGGVVAYSGDEPTPPVEVRIAAAGPFASGLVACAFAGIHAAVAVPAELSAVLLVGAWVNLAGAVVNLLPLPSLDGGRIASALVRARRERRATVGTPRSPRRSSAAEGSGVLDALELDRDELTGAVRP